MASTALLNEESAAIPARHHLPPPTAGYTFVRHVRSALSHDTFMAKTGELNVVVRVYALEYLRHSDECRNMVERAVLVSRVASHPHIVEMREPFASKTDLYAVEQCYSGGDLFEAMETYTRSVTVSGELNPGAGLSGPGATGVSRGLPASVARRIVREIMSGLQYLHTECGLAHRNIKLENIFLDANNCVRVGGLSMCAVLPSARGGDSVPGQLELCCGSKHYAAPELVRGAPYDGESVDVWAVGVVLFALLTGVFPFDSEVSNDALFRNICAADSALDAHPAYRQLEDPLAKDLLRNMLRVDCASRLNVAEVMEHPFLR